MSYIIKKKFVIDKLLEEFTFSVHVLVLILQYWTLNCVTFINPEVHDSRRGLIIRKYRGRDQGPVTRVVGDLVTVWQ